MPILIKGSGGAQKVPEISVNSNGLITAKAGNKSATKQLDSNMDADFVASNIRNGVTIFGVSGEMLPYSRVCYTDYYDEDDTDYVSVDLDNETITIKPKNAADRYGLSKITSIYGISIRIYENDDPYHEFMFAKHGTSSGSAYNRWLYARWSGYASPTSGSADLEAIDHGGFDYTYDETTGELIITGCDKLYKLTEGAFSFDAAITWRISE